MHTMYIVMAYTMLDCIYSCDALINPVCTCTYIVGVVGCNIKYNFNSPV